MLKTDAVAMFARLLVALVLTFCVSAPVNAAGPIETSVFAVQGVAIDVTDVDVATAKNKALVDVQVKAFVLLAEKLGSPSLVESVSKFEAKAIMPYLRSLSIEEEVTSPGRYQGKFTVRFLPNRIRPLYARYGVNVPDVQGPAILIIPVWTENGVAQIWGNNPWNDAWKELHAEQAEIPIITPLGDVEDTELLSAADLANNDPIKLEKIRRRYDVKSVLVAYAEPSTEGGIHAKMEGGTALGKVKFDKVYTDDTGSVPGSTRVAVKRFHEVMVSKYRSDRSKIVAERAKEEAVKSSGPKSIPVKVGFESPSQWNGLRSRILSTPGVIGVDIASLDGNGATISLRYSGGIPEMQSSLQATGLKLERGGGGWVIEQF
jgi:Uncharacterized protein conserved in bacteria (DUF2066)